MSQNIYVDVNASSPLTRSDVERLLVEVGGSQNLYLAGRDLQEIDLAGMHLEYADLSRVKLQQADLRIADLQGANLQGANLQGANLLGANLLGANLHQAYLMEAHLPLVSLQSANLQDANLQGTNLQDANLQGANLRGANLQGANLQDADLRYADLQDANLRHANLQNTKVQNSNLDSVELLISDLMLIKDQIFKFYGFLQVDSAEQIVTLRKAQIGKFQATDVQKSLMKNSSIFEILPIRLNGEPLFAWKVARTITVLTELSTMCWLIAHRRFADLFTYIQTHEIRFAEEAQVEILRISKNSPMNMDWKVDLSAPSVAEALRTAIDGVTQAKQRLKQMELETREKAQQVKHVEQQVAHEEAMNALEEEQRRLELEKQRLAVLEQRLDIQKRGIEDALAIAEKMVVLLYPQTQEEMKPLLVRTLLTPILQLSEIPGLELLPAISGNQPSTGKEDQK
ncbi:hypothetical protein KSF_085940 [Reticulibacter mediterranei]|uniref:Pentapeptide repeat-containing protein n=1 Tax=Reticulibacter mediterranei TaxID=2778369 RepID=A0A8J3IPU5_9CHLR|nr:pentapeptide repeat-containing protein [Reticulibacter mediterranei]GHO98546.1 hypothetical protein KSF_085940 [Reticulibacter mediterranei]